MGESYEEYLRRNGMLGAQANQFSQQVALQQAMANQNQYHNQQLGQMVGVGQAHGHHPPREEEDNIVLLLLP